MSAKASRWLAWSLPRLVEPSRVGQGCLPYESGGQDSRAMAGGQQDRASSSAEGLGDAEEGTDPSLQDIASSSTEGLGNTEEGADPSLQDTASSSAEGLGGTEEGADPSLQDTASSSAEGLGDAKEVQRDWGQVKKGTTEDEMVGWYHQLDAHEFG